MSPLSKYDLNRIELIFSRREEKLIAKLQEQMQKCCLSNMLFNSDVKVEEYKKTVRRINFIYRTFFIIGGIMFSVVSTVGGKIGYDYILKISEKLNPHK